MANAIEDKTYVSATRAASLCKLAGLDISRHRLLKEFEARGIKMEQPVAGATMVVLKKDVLKFIETRIQETMSELRPQVGKEA